MSIFKPVSTKFPHFIHGGDYNPDQWLDSPEILKEDMRLMNLANCNTMSVGIFSWSALEPEEGRFEFEWLDKVMDDLANNNGYAILATPTGARPAWMSQKYPEVLRVGANRVRNLHGLRHNHCYTSPLFRQKSAEIITLLAERYAHHPALLVWHLSNEYGGECHCPLCQEEFRNWLKARYGSLDSLNKAWWTTFWSHTYTQWSQLESPAPHGENKVHGLTIDWKRFVSDRHLDFMKHEIAIIRDTTAKLSNAPFTPVTTNLMGFFPGINYWKMAKELDVVSWDSYPRWNCGETLDDELTIAAMTAMTHDLNRSLGSGKPFLLMESTPSMTNWQSYGKQKRPGMHILSSLQAVAHGSDSVQYFQWRKSRGSSEKFHGAVVDHCGHENTRVFREVSELGAILKQLDDVIGTGVDAKAAILFDWENRWAIEEAEGPRKDDLTDYVGDVTSHYKSLWKLGIATDLIAEEEPFDKYRLIIAPMLYMVKPGVAERLERFVEKGGIFVATYWSGVVNETDLCFLGGFPGPLRKVLGIWSEEIDALGPNETRSVKLMGKPFKQKKETFLARHFCELIHPENAKVIAEYEEDYYKGSAAITVNSFGKGSAWYLAARMEDSFLDLFYKKLVSDANIDAPLFKELPTGVSVSTRHSANEKYIFVMNFTINKQKLILKNKEPITHICGATVDKNELILAGYDFSIFRGCK